MSHFVGLDVSLAPLVVLIACLDAAPVKPRKVHRRFTVIQGGLS